MKAAVLSSAKRNRLVALLAALVVATLGYVLVLTKAAGFFASIDPASTTVSGNATLVTQPDGSKILQFNAPPSTPPPSGSTTCPLPKYPDASCTGVPASANLTTVTGDLLVTTDSAVVDSKNVSGCIDVRAVGVTVKNSKARCITTSQSTRARDPANPRLTIQDSEVNCGNARSTTGIGDRNINVYRVNIHGCENGFDADDYVTIQDSYIHDLFNEPDSPGSAHTDGLQSAVGNYLIIDHNVFYGFDTGCAYPNDGSCNGTSAINICSNIDNCASPIHDTTVSNNLLAGGAYALYCPLVTTINFKVLNNHFSTIYSPHVGEFGPSTNCSSGETLSGNVIHETGQALSLD